MNHYPNDNLKNTILIFSVVAYGLLSCESHVMYLPSSSVTTVTGVLDGPLPTSVNAATQTS